MSDARFPRVFLITDPAHDDDAIVRVVEACADALPPGTFGVQLRDRTRAPAALAPLAQSLRAATRASGTWLILNRHPELARDVGADGVHLGTDAGAVASARRLLGPGAFVSLAAHDDAELLAARDAGASAALVSPIFATPGKGPARGLEALRAARRLLGGTAAVALYALGGVDVHNAAACVDAGVDGVAVIRALLAPPGAADPARTRDVARALLASIEGRTP